MPKVFRLETGEGLCPPPERISVLRVPKGAQHLEEKKNHQVLRLTKGAQPLEDEKNHQVLRLTKGAQPLEDEKNCVAVLPGSAGIRLFFATRVMTVSKRVLSLPGICAVP